MTPAWAQRQEELLSDCVVSPDVFNHMVDRLRDFVVPYQHALETEAGKRNVHLYLAGLLSHLGRKNAEEIADVGRCRAPGHASSSSARRPGIIGRWSRCWSERWSSGWGNPMA